MKEEEIREDRAKRLLEENKSAFVIVKGNQWKS